MARVLSDLESGEESGEVTDDGPDEVSPFTEPVPGKQAETSEVSPERIPASRWGDVDDEIAEQAEKPSRSRWAADDTGDSVVLDEDQKPDVESDEMVSEKPENGNEEAQTLGDPADLPSDTNDGKDNTQDPSMQQQSRKRNMLSGCRSKDDFEHLRDIGQGTYGAVSKYRDKETEEVVALKRIKLDSALFRREGFPMTSVREINILLTMDHPNVVNVSEVVTSSNKNTPMDVYMVMEFIQQDLKAFLSKYKARLKIGEIKRIVLQLLQGVQYLHDNWVIHRDLKPANILYDHFGNVKICDFGMARHYGDPIPMMSPTVVTRNYRGPEICMGVRDYTTALDIWSVGIIAAELLTGKVPFIESQSDIDLINSIARVIGSPHNRWEGFERLPNYGKLSILRDLPNKLKRQLSVQSEGALPVALDHVLSEAGGDLIEQMLQWDPRERICAAEALKHPWFAEMPRPTEGCFMPQIHSSLHSTRLVYD